MQLNLTFLGFSSYKIINSLDFQLYELAGPLLSISNTSQNTLSQLLLQITVYFDNLVPNFSLFEEKKKTKNPESKTYPFIKRNIQVKGRTNYKEKREKLGEKKNSKKQQIKMTQNGANSPHNKSTLTDGMIHVQKGDPELK